MPNDLNTDRDRMAEVNNIRRTRRRRRRRGLNVNRDHQEPMLTIHTTILTFIILAFLFPPLVFVVYTTINVFGKDIALFYKAFIYPTLPTFLYFIHSDLAISCFKTFFVTVIVGFFIATWGTFYYSTRVFIVLVENGVA